MAGFTSAGAAAKDVKTAASDTLIAESTGEQSTTSVYYVKKKVLGMPSNRVRSTLRITFTLKGSSASVYAKGRIYYNGVAIGAEHTVSSTTYQTKTEDITINGNGGTIELWIKTNNESYAAFSDNLSVRGTETEIDQDYEVIA